MKKILKWAAIIFCGMGLIAYTSKIFTEDPASRPVFIGSALVMAFFLFLLLRKKRPKNTISIEPIIHSNLNSDSPKQRILKCLKGVLRGIGITFCCMGIIVYTSVLFIVSPDIPPAGFPVFFLIFLFLDGIMILFLSLLLRKKRLKNAISSEPITNSNLNSDSSKQLIYRKDFYMGIGDIFKASENKQLKKRVSELESMLTPELKDIDSAQRLLEATKEEIESKEKEKENLEKELNKLSAEISDAKKAVIETNEIALLQEFGLYEPVYEFANSELYKARLTEVRQTQKQMIKAGGAATGYTNWTVNGSEAKGRKMVSDMQKLLLRAFNSECDEAVSKVKFSNFDASMKKITMSKDAISKLGSMMGVSIAQAYFNAKIEELHLAYEYKVKKQEEKEDQRRIREELREQAKLQKEIEEVRKNIDKERRHYENALKKVDEKLSSADEIQKDLLEKKKEEIINQLSELDKALKDVDYRAANQKAGYVYIISNLGSFGENIYKIGMTRRLDPMDRIDELGDASVPFKFDVHAMIFTEDAPGLEAALHRAFESRKLNMINHRREFFRVSLDEIKKVVRENYDKTVEFIDVPDAEQYRQSLLIQKNV